MKLLIVNDMLWGGGRERRIVQLIAGLNKLGFEDITLVLLDPRIDYPEVFDLKVNVIRIVRSSSRDLSVFPKLLKIIREFRPDVINPWSYMSTFYAAPLAALLGIRCIGAFVVDAKRPRSFSINWMAMQIGFLLCSKIVANSLAGHRAYRTPAKKRAVIYNGFNEKRLEREFPISQDRSVPVVSMIGRMDPQKDFKTFIDALSLMKKQGVPFRASMVGQGPLSADFERYAHEKCGNSVIAKGFLKDVDSHISGIDVGVLCTDPEFHAEGISNAILEYMAHGKAVVATDGGGTPEIVENNVSGVIVPPKNPFALADALRQLIEMPEIREQYGLRGKEIVKEKFSLEGMAKGFAEIYRA